MTLFNILWNLTLGITGGIISSIIVSRIFLIQGDFQNQINSFEQVLHKLGYTNGMLSVIRTVQEVSYDTDIEMHKEMNKKGVSSENEYYKMHADKNWISKDKLIKDILTECKKINTSLKDELMNLRIKEYDLQQILVKLNEYVSELSSTKEISFLKLNELDKQCQEIVFDYESYRKTSGKKLLFLILKDKVMIILFIFVVLLIVATIITYMLKI